MGEELLGMCMRQACPFDIWYFLTPHSVNMRKAGWHDPVFVQCTCRPDGDAAGRCTVVRYSVCHRSRDFRQSGSAFQRGGLNEKAGFPSKQIALLGNLPLPLQTILSPKGRSRSRLPVAAKMALARAGANGGTPGSPTPVALTENGCSTICVMTLSG